MGPYPACIDSPIRERHPTTTTHTHTHTHTHHALLSCPSQSRSLPISHSAAGSAQNSSDRARWTRPGLHRRCKAQHPLGWGKKNSMKKGRGGEQRVGDAYTSFFSPPFSHSFFPFLYLHFLEFFISYHFSTATHAPSHTHQQALSAQSRLGIDEQPHQRHLP